MTNVLQLPVTGTTDRPAPTRIVRPCEYGLRNAVAALETQLGTVEAYNRLCDAAARLKAQIDEGGAKLPIPVFATDPQYIYPQGHAPRPVPKKGKP